MFYDVLGSDPDPTKRFGSDRIRIRNTGDDLNKFGTLGGMYIILLKWALNLLYFDPAPAVDIEDAGYGTAPAPP